MPHECSINFNEICDGFFVPSEYTLWAYKEHIKSNHISNWNKLTQTTQTHTWNKQFAQDGKR